MYPNYHLSALTPDEDCYGSKATHSTTSSIMPFHVSCLYRSVLSASSYRLLKRSIVRKTGVVGFIATATSMMGVFDDLVKAADPPLDTYILTYNFSQDHLELFFSTVRSRCGSNNNPSALQLRCIWKWLLTHNEVKAAATKYEV